MTERNDLVQTGMDFLKGAMWYAFNTPPREIVETIYGTGHHGGYLDEKLDKLLDRGLLYLYGELDGASRERLVEAIYDRYGKDFD
jgi:lauroyl/myristoyl acyltransferase